MTLRKLENSWILKKENISLLVSFLTAVYVAFYSHKLSLIESKKSLEYTSEKEAIINVIENVYSYRTPFTIDYDSLEEVRYSNYKCADPLWDTTYTPKYESKVGNPDLHDTCWAVDRVAKIRNDFQRKTIKARVLGSEEINQALDDIEMGFDEVLDYYFGHDYYMRAFPDAYMRVMPKKFDHLVDIAKKEIRE